MYMYKCTCTCSSFFLGKVTALGVLCYFALLVCLTLLACFFLPSHFSLKHEHVCDKHAYTVTSRLIFSITDLADVVLHQSGTHIDLVAAPGVFSR